MLDNLFHIPSTFLGWPMFGFGILLLVWAAASGALVTYLIRKQGWNADTRGYIPVLSIIGAAIWFLLPRLSEAKGLPIRGYGTMVLIGVAAGIWLAAARARRANINPEVIYSLALWLFVFGMLGGRAFYVIENWKEQFSKPNWSETLAAVANISQGGLVVFGAFVGATPVFIAFARKNRLPVLATFDLIAPSMVLGLAIGRLGCFLHGCCFGGTCTLPWAVTFPQDSPVYARHARDGLVDPQGIRFQIEKDSQGKPDFTGPAIIAEVEHDSNAEKAGLKKGDLLLAILAEKIRNAHDANWALARIASPGAEISVTVQGRADPIRWIVSEPLPRSRPVHPVQIYAAINALALCLFLLAWYPYRRKDGEILAWMLVLHPISRYLEEALRNDDVGVWGTGLRNSQNLSVIMFVVGAGLWWYLWRYGQGELNFYLPRGNQPAPQKGVGE